MHYSFAAPVLVEIIASTALVEETGMQPCAGSLPNLTTVDAPPLDSSRVCDGPSATVLRIADCRAAEESYYLIFGTVLATSVTIFVL